MEEEITVKKKKKYCKGGNGLTRVSNKFLHRLNNIDFQRKGLNQEKISQPKKTELIIRHVNWKDIEKDIINFDSKQDKKKEDINDRE